MSSTTPPRQKGRAATKANKGKATNNPFALASPTAELMARLTALEETVAEVRQAHIEDLRVRRQESLPGAPPSAPSPSSSSSALSPSSGGLGRFFRRKGGIAGAEASPTAEATSSTAATASSSSLMGDGTAAAPPLPPPLSTTPTTPHDRGHRGPGQSPTTQPQESVASFVEFPDPETFVEHLRRVAELAVVGENYGTTLQRKEENAYLRAKEKWKSRQLDVLDLDVDETETQDDGEDGGDGEEHQDEYLQLFDLFFERNALELIIAILTGAAFQLTDEEKRELSNGSGENEPGCGPSTDATDGLEASDSTRCSTDLNTFDRKLPHFQIATQALQSVSILIQNVSRATSLYVILSNNRINELINLPLDLYLVAGRNYQKSDPSTKSQPPSMMTIASPEISELTTHFVTFLKSLAMRMNAQTLQFFLKYPADVSGGGGGRSTTTTADSNDNDAVVPPAEEMESEGSFPSLHVEFPLYERSLEFCAAHQDSFVRVTAMNICLNTLRLTTVSPPHEANGGAEGSILLPASSPRSPGTPSRGMSSPDGVLHNAEPLPFQERLAIAQYTCVPSRVERLVSPIFAKLAERWNGLDEQIRDIDHHLWTIRNGGGSPLKDKLLQAKEKVRRERMVRTFNDRAADLQDELLLLEDVFTVRGLAGGRLLRSFQLHTVYPGQTHPLSIPVVHIPRQVGLTVLNEQVIEMMLATFVYPLLMQPLLLYYQRLSTALETPGYGGVAEHPFGGDAADYSATEPSLAPASGPAKAALFSLGAVFQLLSNKSLLRLLFTALLHPLSPDSSGVPTLRSTLEVATQAPGGRKLIRLDDPALTPPGDRSTYAFGTRPGNRRSSSVNIKAPRIPDGDAGGEACVFVLSPALAEVLEFNGEDVSLLARTRPNPYRRSLLKLLEAPDAVSHVRELAVATLDAAANALDAQLAAAVLFGTDLRSLGDDIPLDEFALDSLQAHQQDDRGIGGSAEHASRMSLPRAKRGAVGSDPMSEALRGLCRCVLVAERQPSSVADWTIGYDSVAAHAVLCLMRGLDRAQQFSAKTLDYLWRQAATFVVESTGKIHSPMGGSSIPMDGCPSINAPDYDQQIEGALLNYVFYDRMDSEDGTPVVNELLQLQLRGPDSADSDGYSIGISLEGSFDTLCDRIGRPLLDDLERDPQAVLSDRDEVQLVRRSLVSLLRADALVSLLKDLTVTGGRLLGGGGGGGARVGGPLSGLALSAEGMSVSLKDCRESQLHRQVFAPLSSKVSRALFSDGAGGALPATGSSLDLSGKPLIPCVCEAPASLSGLFSGEGLGVVSEGVTWQSLYLTFTDGAVVLAQPQPDGDGRVISACYLERLTVRRDMEAAVSGPPARRLLLSHHWFEDRPPAPLFLFDEIPRLDKVGPFVRVSSMPKMSTVDVWLEDQSAADHAFRVLSHHIFAAKSQRGQAAKFWILVPPAPEGPPPLPPPPPPPPGGD